MNPNVDYQSLYRNITNKLKKRFMKKPNINEAGESFANVAKVLKDEECPEYAALFTLGQARCEASLNNSSNEASCLISAAKLFMEAEEKLKAIHSVTLEENLDCAIMCYGKAQKIYEDNKNYSLASTVSSSIADALMLYGKHSEASVHYQKVADLLSSDYVCCLQALANFAHCQIKLRNFYGALYTCAKMQKILFEHSGSPIDGRSFGVYSELLLNSEIYRVLLLLIVDPLPDKAFKEEPGFSLDRYFIESNSRSEDSQLAFMNEELFILLQSLVLAYRVKNVSCIQLLSCDLQSHLDYHQRELLIEMVQQMTTPGGEAF